VAWKDLDHPLLFVLALLSRSLHDDEILINYQCLVGSLTYFAIFSCPDIAYAAMALGQFNAKPTRAHLLVAKGILRYLAGTLDYGLEYAVPISSIPLTVTPFSQGYALTDTDWALDENDQKRSGGYHLYDILQPNACTGICFLPRGPKI